MGSLTVKVRTTQSCCSAPAKKPSDFDFISVHGSISQRVDKEIAEKLRLVESQVTYVSEEEYSQDFVLQRIKQAAVLQDSVARLRYDPSRLAQLQKESPAKQLTVTITKPVHKLITVAPVGTNCEGVTVLSSASGDSLLIYFDPETDRYLLTDLGGGYFAKLDISCVLQNGQILRLGNTYFVIRLESLDSLLRVNTLTLEIYAPSSTSVRKFYAIDSTSRTLLIGRESCCDIPIDDRMLSKVQASLFYNGVEWVLVDGNLEFKRTSTNGTWLYVGEDFEVPRTLTVKNSQITCHIMKHF